MFTGPTAEKFHKLRTNFPFFSFEEITIQKNESSLNLAYHFNLSDNYTFTPRISIPKKHFLNFDINEKELYNLAFHIGMIELVSYWKAACSPRVIIKTGTLDAWQQRWWKKQYYHGLGEFFYTNNIRISETEMMDIISEGPAIGEAFSFDAGDKILLPVGGGKDSAVSLELLKDSGKQAIPFIVNPRQASLDTARQAGFQGKDILEIKRSIDPQLLQLNRQGFLNGHTPFSAVLAFLSLLGSWLSKCRHIALSNEASANEATIPGTKINHQYSKSFDFERDFRTYSQKYLSPDFNYFSLLRPLNELQIARLFSAAPGYFADFKSCNAGSKTDSWCGKCPKCLFTWIMLQPFLGENRLLKIFGKNLMDDSSLIPILKELSGLSKEKPFECVGTIAEVRSALKAIILAYPKDKLPALPAFFASQAKTAQINNIGDFLKQYNPEHFLNTEFDKLLREKIQ